MVRKMSAFPAIHHLNSLAVSAETVEYRNTTNRDRLGGTGLRLTRARPDPVPITSQPWE